MTKSSGRYGVRNSLPANREQWHNRQPGRRAESTTIATQDRLQKVAIGRFLLSKAEATTEPDRLANPIVNVAKMFGAMNRNRGVSIEPAAIMLTYVTPMQFSERVAMRAEARKYSNKTLGHQRDQIRRAKEQVREYFNEVEQADTAAVGVRLEQMADVEKQTIRTEFIEDCTESGEEVPGNIDELVDMVPIWIDDPGSHKGMGSTNSGFTFRNRIFYDGLVAGMNVSQSDPVFGEQFQQDIDIVNDALRNCDLIGGRLGPLLAKEIAVHIPLFIASDAKVAEDIHPPFVPIERVSFQKLGIHQIQ